MYFVLYQRKRTSMREMVVRRLSGEDQRSIIEDA